VPDKLIGRWIPRLQRLLPNSESRSDDAAGYALMLAVTLSLHIPGHRSSIRAVSDLSVSSSKFMIVFWLFVLDVNSKEFNWFRIREA